MSCGGSFRDEPCHHASLCVWRQPCADECLNLTHLQPARPVAPVIRFVRMNRCVAAAEEAARMALARCVFREGLTPRLTGAGARSAEGTSTGHKNAEGMASVGVRVEPTVRLGSEGTTTQPSTD
jgi:hypothetical protein